MSEGKQLSLMGKSHPENNKRNFPLSISKHYKNVGVPQNITLKFHNGQRQDPPSFQIEMKIITTQRNKNQNILEFHNDRTPVIHYLCHSTKMEKNSSTLNNSIPNLTSTKIMIEEVCVCD